MTAMGTVNLSINEMLANLEVLTWRWQKPKLILVGDMLGMPSKLGLGGSDLEVPKNHD